jgi:hypothetical protein
LSNLSSLDLKATFATIPGAEPVSGLPDAWTWSSVGKPRAELTGNSSRYGFAAVLSRDGAHAFQCYAHDSYDESLVRAILAFARGRDAELIAPPERPLVAVEGFAHPRYGFDMLVAICPSIHRYHEEKPDVHEATRAVFPAYRCEFSGEEDEVEAAYRYDRAAGVEPTRWNREPNPYLRMRMRTWDDIPERGFAWPPTLLSELASLPKYKDGFVEFENYERRVWAVTWRDAYVLAEGRGEPRRMDLDELTEFVKQALYGPNRASGESALTGP